MADQHHKPHGDQHVVYDAEIDFKTITMSAVVLIGVTLVSLLLMWGMGAAFRKAEEGKDPPKPVMVEATLDPIPPGPRLQSAPPADMDEMRARDKQALTTYGWVDQANGVARIPIDRAMSIVLEKGIGSAAGEKKEAK
jgi:hypothetical protein